MIFYDIIWLILFFPAVVFLLLFKAPSRAVKYLRFTIITLLIFALANLAIRLPDKTGAVVIITDRSKSMPKKSEKQLANMIKIVGKNKPNNSQYSVISFAEKAENEKPLDNSIFTNFKIVMSGNQSRLDLSLRQALSAIPDDRPGRILLLSDGRWTGDNPSSLFAECFNRGIAVDYRVIERSQSKDTFISNIEVPQDVQVNEFYTIRVEINSPVEQTVDYMLTKNNFKLYANKLKLKQGNNIFYFKDISQSPKIMKYQFKIIPSENIKDVFPENNTAKFFVRAVGAKPLLLITMSKKSGFGKLLNRSGLNVQVKLPSEIDFSIGGLATYSGIIIENVPANLITQTGMETIVQLVKNSGMGLMMTGGKNSYALGGYYNSPLQEVMPVSMELKQEHRKLKMAIVIVLDRSGSMGMHTRVDPTLTKMDVANEATVEVIKLLGPNDQCGVFAVDSEPHKVLDLMSSSQALAMKWKVLDIASGGGGIFVYNGLVAATEMLAKSNASTRHIILFADANDAEQPEDYVNLLQKAQQAGITASVIGLGSEQDRDAEFLKDVAKRGNGRCFFASQANELPRLFAQDTFVVARNTFNEEKTKVKFSGELKTLGNFRNLNKLVIDGYNLNYLRPKAYCAAISTDEFKSPLVSFWQANLGRVICYSGEVDGEFAKSFSNWSETSKLLSSMVKWAVGLNQGSQNLSDDLLVTQELKNGVNVIKLHLNPDRKLDPFAKMPEVSTIKSIKKFVTKDEKSSKSMTWVDADTLVAKIPLEGDEVSLSTIKIGNLKPFTSVPATLPFSPEFSMKNNSNSAQNIKKLAKMTGGIERVSLDSIWDDLPSKIQVRSIRSYLITLAIILFLLEILERRTGVLFRNRDFKSLFKKEPKEKQKTENSNSTIQSFEKIKKQKIVIPKTSKVTSENNKVEVQAKAVNQKDESKMVVNKDNNSLFDAFAKVKKKDD
ncbi:VWA domain-containing protein [Lentisphaerota bacterium WC36G]|nr:VWA domain-containing protein [Lentisphaerae bacterium WC36]